MFLDQKKFLHYRYKYHYNIYIDWVSYCVNFIMAYNLYTLWINLRALMVWCIERLYTVEFYTRTSLHWYWEIKTSVDVCKKQSPNERCMYMATDRSHSHKQLSIGAPFNTLRLVRRETVTFKIMLTIVLSSLSDNFALFSNVFYRL